MLQNKENSARVKEMKNEWKGEGKEAKWKKKIREKNAVPSKQS